MSIQAKYSEQTPSPQEIADGYRALGNLIGRPPLSHVTLAMGRLIDAHFINGKYDERMLMAGLVKLAAEPDRFLRRPTAPTTFEVIAVNNVTATKRLGSGK